VKTKCTLNSKERVLEVSLSITESHFTQCVALFYEFVRHVTFPRKTNHESLFVFVWCKALGEALFVAMGIEDQKEEREVLDSIFPDEITGNCPPSAFPDCLVHLHSS
jgi:hypothetical protein